MENNVRLINFWIRKIIGAILVGGLLGFSGAFGTQYLPLIIRLSYWISSIVFCTIFANFVGLWLDSVFDSEAKPLFYHAIFLAILALILPVFIAYINHLAFGHQVSINSYRGLFLPVFIVSLFMTVLHYFVEQIPMQSHAINNPESQKSFRPKIFERLEIKFRNAQIFAIKSEDHYLRIFTSMGETLILLRLYDAINELEGIEGVQTHRS